MNWEENIECTGCNLCVISCSSNALIMKENYEGFLYPHLNLENCNFCGQCLSICPEKEKEENDQNAYPIVYAAINKNEEIRLRSTSGGIFSELAEFVLKQNGCVVGAAYEKDFSVVHKLINNKKELDSIRRSKYVQSEMRDIYQEMENVLKNGIKVLFCGTPCQTAAVKKGLEKYRDHLYLCDLLCIGVSSPKVYRSYIEWLEKKEMSGLTELWFKNKQEGWKNLGTLAKFEDGKQHYEAGTDNCYIDAYLKHEICSRECCYQCNYKTVPHGSDITLGDFWGLSHTHLEDDKGTSLVMVNSKKGEVLFNGISRNIEYKRSTVWRVAQSNRGLYEVQKRNPNRNTFFNNLNLYSLDKALNVTLGKENPLN